MPAPPKCPPCTRQARALTKWLDGCVIFPSMSPRATRAMLADRLTRSLHAAHIRGWKRGTKGAIP